MADCLLSVSVSNFVLTKPERSKLELVQKACRVKAH